MKYHPWQEELFEWTSARESAQRDALSAPPKTISEMKQPDASVENLIGAARSAYNRPEIWSMFEDLCKRLEADPNASLEATQLNLCTQYFSWYRLSNQIDEKHMAYALIPGLLREVVTGKIKIEDDDAIEEWIRRFPFVAPSRS